MQARSSDIQFKVGDKAVYPARGVAEVVKIEEKDIAGSRQHFYVLRILDTDHKVMVPVSNASAVGLRQVVSEQEVREIFDILKERTIAFDNQEAVPHNVVFFEGRDANTPRILPPAETAGASE